MAFHNTIEACDKLIKKSRNALQRSQVSLEPPQNCGHGSHKKFYQGFITDPVTPDCKYMTIAYEKSITEEQIRGMLTFHTDKRGGNDPNNRNGIEDQGMGLKMQMIHYGCKVWIYTEKGEKDNKSILCTSWDIKKQRIWIEKNRTKEGESEKASPSINGEQFISRCDEESELWNNIKKLRNKLYSACEEGITKETPKTIIFIKLHNRYMKTEMDRLNKYTDEDFKLFAKIFALTERLEFFKLKEETNCEIMIEKMKPLDITGFHIKEDYIKIPTKIYDEREFLFRIIGKNNIPFFFSLSANGRRPGAVVPLVNENGMILSDLKPVWKERIEKWKLEGNSFKHTCDIEFYRWNEEKAKELKIEKELRKAMGVYFLMTMKNTDGWTLVSDKPRPVDQILLCGDGTGCKNKSRVGNAQWRSIVRIQHKPDTQENGVVEDNCIIMNEIKTKSEESEPLRWALSSVQHWLHRQYYKYAWAVELTKKDEKHMYFKKNREVVPGDMVVKFLFDDDKKRPNSVSGKQKFYATKLNISTDISGNIVPKKRKKPHTRSSTKDSVVYMRLYERDIEKDEEFEELELIMKVGLVEHAKKGKSWNKLKRDRENDQSMALNGYMISQSIAVYGLTLSMAKMIEDTIKEECWEKNPHEFERYKGPDGHDSDRAHLVESKSSLFTGWYHMQELFAMLLENIKEKQIEGLDDIQKKIIAWNEKVLANQ